MQKDFATSKQDKRANDADDARDDVRAEQQSQATQLVRLAEAAELFHTPEGKAYAMLRINGHYENWPLSSKVFGQWLARSYYETYNRVPSALSVKDALGVLNGKAIYEGFEEEVHLRTAEYDGNIYLDLCDEDWRVVRIGKGGWQVIDEPPVRFRRTKNMQPLPTPVIGGKVEELRPFVNIGSEDEWTLLLAWLVGAMKPSGPYPLLILQGEQGSAKTTTARVLCELTDPNTAALRSEPRTERDLMIAASNRHIAAFDNLSRIDSWLSDALCRMSTGGGFATRELYSDSEETIFNVQRPIMFTGIEELATRSDLLDRAIMLNLPPIAEEQRRGEAGFWKSFYQAQPRILGALLFAVSAALRNVGSVSLQRLPRMADFAIWATAAEPALGLEKGQFMSAYETNREAANKLAMETSSIAAPLLKLMSETEVWEGNASELLVELEKRVEEDVPRRVRSWPKQPRQLSDALQRIASNLRGEGIEVKPIRTSSKRLIRLVKGAATASSASLASQEAPITQGIGGKGDMAMLVPHDVTYDELNVERSDADDEYDSEEMKSYMEEVARWYEERNN